MVAVHGYVETNYCVTLDNDEIAQIFSRYQEKHPEEAVEGSIDEVFANALAWPRCLTN